MQIMSHFFEVFFLIYIFNQSINMPTTDWEKYAPEVIQHLYYLPAELTYCFNLSFSGFLK